MPGERVEVKGGKVLVNGNELDQSSLQTVVDNNNYQAVVVPPNSYYLLGDNRPNSEDSRYIGPVER